MNPFSISSTSRDNFCNRVNEIATLQQYMRAGIHAVVYAPRRFGKSSLAHVVQSGLTDMDRVYVDLFSVTSISEVARLLYFEIANVLGADAARQTTILQLLGEFFTRVKFTLSFNAQELEPKIDVSLGESSAELCIKDVIAALDAWCLRHQRRVCIVLDEFQEICELKESKQIEAFLRGGMQQAERVSFMFMGSRRSLLKDMFENKTRPFYKSTIKFELPAMQRDVFADFIADRFAMGGYPVSREVADEIISFTDGYPYYTQKLALFHYNTLESGDTDLEKAKSELIRSESSDFESIYVTLAANQKKVLKSVARKPTANLYASEYLRDNNLGAASSVRTAVDKLLKLDLIESREGKWRTVDPVLEKWLRRYPV